ncbi:MAG: ABC transporter [Proteobacteria bacterium]|nr:MAG: ABC transporter [Pseudomonadota bacterium]
MTPVPLLQAEHISLQRKNHYLLRDVSLELYPGELLGLIGPNGAGKSILMQVLLGLLTADQGIIHLKGKALQQWSMQARSQEMAWVEQQGLINWPLPVERLVALGRIPHLPGWQRPREQDKQAIEQAMYTTDIQHLRQRDTSTLSGGERARVLMARALAAQPTILLADEPIAALDPRHQLQTMELLRTFAQQQRASLVVLHELSLAARYCDRLCLLQEGQLVASGGIAEVLTPKRLRQVYGVDCLVGYEGVPWIIPVKRVETHDT